jgi:leucyl-tRNA synthetase
MEVYNHNDIEKKWQKKWEEDGLYTTGENGDKKFYILDMFPYPSGEGLHVGHPKGYIATDVYSRMKRMQGYDVLHPMGFDAFGLPAEQYALKNKVNPNVSTAKNVARYKEQLKMLGLNYDWGREVNTTDPKFYKWTQWMWKQMYKKGLAYESYDPINWCPVDKTGLANEDLENGRCERCGSLVEKKSLRQWTIRITDYADRLLSDLDKLNWEPHIKELQKNWIGKSEGSMLRFAFTQTSQTSTDLADGLPEFLEVFTTRADTMYGATFIAISTDLAETWISKGWKPTQEVLDCITHIKEEAKQQDFSFKEVLEKKGIDTGIFAINPVNGETIPVWIANYVLSGYGTGALMAVPAHDERDYEFAKKYNLPSKQVVAPAFVQTTEPGRFREDKETIVRDGIITIIKHWSEDTYVALKWKKVAWVTLQTGTVDEGFTPEETVLKEILEETGYTHAKIIKNLGVVDGIFYHVPKEINKHVHGHIFYVELEDGERSEVSKVEDDLHEIIWMSYDELKASLTADTHQYAIDVFKSGYKPYSGDGSVVNSGLFTGLHSKEAKIKITEKVGGKLTSTYKLKDWVFARQRYWGEPFPIVFDENHVSYAVADSELPVELPMVDEYEPTGTGESPLANIKDWVEVYGYINSDGEFESVKNYLKFEDQFVEGVLQGTKSSTIRIDRKNLNEGSLVALKKQNGETFAYAKISSIIDKKFKDLPIENKEGTSYASKEDQLSAYKKYYEESVNDDTDFYIITFNVVDVQVKLFKRETNTMPQWAGSSWYYLRYIDPHNETAFADKEKEKKWSPVDFYVGGAEHATRHLIFARFWHKFLFDLGYVHYDEPFTKLQTVGLIMAEDGRKMSKRWKNVVNPDDVVKEYGADTLRLYEMFMGPFDQSIAWSTSSMAGVHRFLERFWKLQSKISDSAILSNEAVTEFHKTIKKVGEDIEQFKFNTAISQMMILLNLLEKETSIPKGVYTTFTQLLAPFAPHVTEQIFENLGNTGSIHTHSWPEYDSTKLLTETVTLAIQISGKMRGTIEIQRDLEDSLVFDQIKATEMYAKYVGESVPKKVIIIKNKIANIVI